jgi:transcriptional regulator with XRE-family HTH domain
MKGKNEALKIAFGRRVKQLIDQKGLVPQDVAANANIEVKQVYRVINAEHNATLALIGSIAKGLGVHPRDLFDFEITQE